MKLKYFFVILFVYIVVVGLYIFSLNGERYTYTVPISGHLVELPIAVWFVIPIVVFAGIVLLLEIESLFKNWIQSRKYHQDYESLLEQIQAELLEKEFHNLPKTRNYKTLSVLLGNLHLVPKVEMSKKTGDSRLDNFLESLGDVQRGNYIDLKKYQPNPQSKLALQNFTNRIEEDEKFVIEVLRDSKSTEAQKQQAYKRLLQKGDERDIKKYMHTITLNNEMAKEILQTCCYTQKIHFTLEEIVQICSNADFTQNDYITLAKHTKECFTPQSWIELFETLSNKNEKAEVAYCYILLDLEMIEVAKERLGNMPIEDRGLLKLKAYLDLKEGGKNYALDLFFT